MQIVDISNPANPVKKGYIPSHVDTFSGEGSQVVTLDTPSFKGDLLVYQNEWCPQTTNGVGGVSLVDVRIPMARRSWSRARATSPRSPAQHPAASRRPKPTRRIPRSRGRAGGKGRCTSSSWMTWRSSTSTSSTSRTRASRRWWPRWNLDSTHRPGATRPHGDAVFSHDMVVKKIGGKDVMLMSYWDGGYVQLDVTDPTAGAEDPRRHRLRGDRPGAKRVRPDARGQRPPGGVHPRQRVLLRHRRGLRPVPRDGDDHRRRARWNGLHRRPGR